MNFNIQSIFEIGSNYLGVDWINLYSDESSVFVSVLDFRWYGSKYKLFRTFCFNRDFGRTELFIFNIPIING